MSSSGKIISEIAPWAILAVGALYVIKNPDVVGQAINWIYNLIPGKSGGGGGGGDGNGGGGGGGNNSPITTINLPGVGNVSALNDPNALALLTLLFGTPNPNWWPQPNPNDKNGGGRQRDDYNKPKTPAPTAPPVSVSGTILSNANYQKFMQDAKTGTLRLRSGAVIKTSSVPLVVNGNGNNTSSRYPNYADARKLILTNPVNKAAALRDPMYGIAYP